MFLILTHPFGKKIQHVMSHAKNYFLSLDRAQFFSGIILIRKYFIEFRDHSENITIRVDAFLFSPANSCHVLSFMSCHVPLELSVSQSCYPINFKSFRFFFKAYQFKVPTFGIKVHIKIPS